MIEDGNGSRGKLQLVANAVREPQILRPRAQSFCSHLEFFALTGVTNRIENSPMKEMQQKRRSHALFVSLAIRIVFRRA